jgi:drug/metabolite transporter (DMT)-like permease
MTTSQIGKVIGSAATGTVASVGLSILFVASWSSGFIGAKLGAADADVATVLMWRFLPLAALLAVPAWWLTRRRGTKPTRRALSRQVAIGLLSQSGYLLTVYWAIALGVNTGTTALIDGIQPLVAAALIGPVLGAAVSGRQWCGLVLGSVGVAIVTLADAGTNATAPAWSYAVPVLGMLSLVAATFVERREPGGVSPFTALAIHCSTSAVVFTVIAVATGQAVVPTDASFWWAIAWLVALPTFGGYGLYWVLLRRIGVTRVNTLMFLMAPVTGVWGALAFGESFTLTTALGMGVGVVAVAVVSTGGRSGSVANPGSSAAQCSPRPGAPQRPGDQQRLEEESDQAGAVGVESERVPMVDVLGDVAGEHRDEERRDDPPHHHRVAIQEQQRDTEHDLDHTRRDHDESGVEGDPVRDLRVELVAREGQMR